MYRIEDIQAIGDMIAIRWKDEVETFHQMGRLRALSPSAETAGERDLLGNEIGWREQGRNYSKVTVTSWGYIGNYAIQFRFSDGHSSGIYAYDYLRSIADPE